MIMDWAFPKDPRGPLPADDKAALVEFLKTF